MEVDAGKQHGEGASEPSFGSTMMAGDDDDLELSNRPLTPVLSLHPVPFSARTSVLSPLDAAQPRTQTLEARTGFRNSHRTFNDPTALLLLPFRRPRSIESTCPTQTPLARAKECPPRLSSRASTVSPHQTLLLTFILRPRVSPYGRGPGYSRRWR